MRDSAAQGMGSMVAWLLLACALLGYLRAAIGERRGRRGWSGWRAVSFTVGIALVAVATAPRVDAWAGHDLRGHMVQHLLLGMLAPLALVLGAPITLLLRALPVTVARRMARLLGGRICRRAAHPAVALALDTGGVYLLYLTPLFAAMHSSALLRGALHLHFLAAGFLFAWSLAGVDPAPHRARLGTRLAALFVAVAAHGTLAKVMYAYGWPRGTHHAPEQLRDAARLMYYGGDAAELLLAVAVFWSWYRSRVSSFAPPAGPAPPPPAPRPASRRP